MTRIWIKEERPRQLKHERGKIHINLASVDLDSKFQSVPIPVLPHY